MRQLGDTCRVKEGTPGAMGKAFGYPLRIVSIFPNPQGNTYGVMLPDGRSLFVTERVLEPLSGTYTLDEILAS
jgi:hypothetical protein